MASSDLFSDSDSDSEGGGRVFQVIGEREPSCEPTSALEYLQQVKWEKRRLQKVVIAPNLQTEEFFPRKTVEEIAQIEALTCAAALPQCLPGQDWAKQTIQLFSHLRSCLEQAASLGPPSWPLPHSNDKDRWRRYCLGPKKKKESLHVKKSKLEAPDRNPFPDPTDQNKIQTQIPPQTTEHNSQHKINIITTINSNNNNNNNNNNNDNNNNSNNNNKTDNNNQNNDNQEENRYHQKKISQAKPSVPSTKQLPPSPEHAVVPYISVIQKISRSQVINLLAMHTQWLSEDYEKSQSSSSSASSSSSSPDTVQLISEERGQWFFALFALLSAPILCPDLSSDLHNLLRLLCQIRAKLDPEDVQLPRVNLLVTILSQFFHIKDQTFL